MKPTRRLILQLAAALSVASRTATAQSYPTRPVRIIVPLASGGTPDIICRIVAERLSEAIGKPVVIENLPGASNVIGAELAAKAAPDGYTLLFATAATLVTNPYTFKTLPYDPLNDFVPIAMIAQGPFVVLAHPSVPAKTLGELFAYDKANPGKLTFATDGPRNLSGMLAAWLNKLAGGRILQVPYATMPQGVQDAPAGRVQLIVLQVYFGTTATVLPLLRAGKLKALAVTSPKRSPLLPAIPTMIESGLPELSLTLWMGMLAPAGTPAPVLNKLNSEINQSLRSAKLAARMSELGFEPKIGTPQDFAGFIADELPRWSAMVKASGAKVD